MTVHAQATIRNEAGIHCRPSTHIIKEIRDYPGRILVRHPVHGEVCIKDSMLDLMMLELTCGTSVDVEVSGPDEAAWLEKTVTLFEKTYDFPDAGN